MLYIIVAFKAEAQAFIDRYKMSKTKLGNFVAFKNEKIILIISGVGTKMARDATQTCINNFDITDEDIYLNLGICGANRSYEIGELLEIGEVLYKGISYKFKKSKTITCLDEKANDNIYEIVDMESFGFYDAVIHNPAIKNFYILKVVSDHFEPQKVTKDKSKMLIFNAIDAINTLLNI